MYETELESVHHWAAEMCGELLGVFACKQRGPLWGWDIWVRVLPLQPHELASGVELFRRVLELPSNSIQPPRKCKRGGRNTQRRDVSDLDRISQFQFQQSFSH